jgi:dTDP-4-amino-4,6-dideoxygalactose transaminase
MHEFYKMIFSDNKGVQVLSEPTTDYFSNHWLSAILIDPAENNGKTREDLRLTLEAKNIESRPLWKPMHLQPIFNDAPYYGGTVSEELFQNGLCLPSGSNLTELDRERIKIELISF